MGKCEMLNGKVIKTPNEIYPFGVLFFSVSRIQRSLRFT